MMNVLNSMALLLMGCILFASPSLAATNTFSDASVTAATDVVPLTVTGVNAGTSNLIEVVDGTAATVLYVDSGGTTYTVGGTVSSISDARLKENVETIPNALEKIQKMRGTTFTWKDSKKRDMGFIAQEVLDVEPKLVTQPTSGDMQEYYHVAYPKFAPLLVQGMNELKAELDKLKGTVKTLQDALDECSCIDPSIKGELER